MKKTHHQLSPQHDLIRILNIDRELDKIKDIDILLEYLLTFARKEAHADAGTVYLRKGKELAFSHTQNDTFQKKLKPNEKLPYAYFTVPINDQSISGFVANHKIALNISDMYNIPKKRPYKFDSQFDKITGYKTVSTLTIPLISTEDEVLGVMQLINAKNEHNEFIPFKVSELPFFEAFSRFGAKAIQRAQMTRHLLETISRLAGLRDPLETNFHVNRVGAYSMEIYEAWATKNKIPHDEKEKNRDILRMAAMLHDVGKVGISDLILKKPDRFTDSEYSIMKSHTWLGARQFSDESDLSSIARDVALHHHENWDGTGYPGRISNLDEADECLTNGFPPGLSGQEIPLFARIVSIADVWDALTSKRVYKDAWTEKDSLKEMERESGRKFDPNLIDVFFSIRQNLNNIRNRYPDIAE